jgi:sugar O-acyltransferase (sialic acid O-acetyltransferase NeuD family)
MRGKMGNNSALKLVIVGDSIFAQIAYEYFTYDSPYDVVAFSVEKDFLTKATLFDRPVFPFEDLEKTYSPVDHHIFVAVALTSLNKLRTRLYIQAIRKGYHAAAYWSSRTIISKSSEIGEHCFICEDTVIQQHAKIGNNVIVWSGSYIGHNAKIGSNCFMLPGAVVCEFAEVGENCVIGANSTIAKNARITGHTVIEAGDLVVAV